MRNLNIEIKKQIKYLSTNYCNLISKSNFLITVFVAHLKLSLIDIIMELVKTLPQAVIRKTNNDKYIDN